MQHEEWIVVNFPDMVSLPRTVLLRSQNLLPRQRFPLHTHQWSQFVYATKGSLVVTVEGSWFVITPEQGIWVPSGVLHTTGTFGGAEFRSLWIAHDNGVEMPAGCSVFNVTPLMRALIAELEAASMRAETMSYLDKLDALTLEHLKRLPVQDFHLPWPVSRVLQGICEALYENPSDSRCIDDWAKELGVSSRTLARRFERETGIGLRKWKHRLRLFLALEWLGSTKSITDIALDLGYSSTAAFTYMFRCEMGCAPTEWRSR